MNDSCSFCQSATADIHFDAYATDQFLLVGAEDIQDRASEAFANEMLAKVPNWNVRQEALRGEIQDPGRNSIWDSITGTGKLIDSYKKLLKVRR